MSLWSFSRGILKNSHVLPPLYSIQCSIQYKLQYIISSGLFLFQACADASPTGQMTPELLVQNADVL